MPAPRMIYKIKQSNDHDAITINQMLDDVNRAIATGHYLDEILRTRFVGNPKKFIKWIRANLDRNIQTIVRKIVISRNAELLRQQKIVRLRDAYDLLDLTCNVGIHKLLRD